MLPLASGCGGGDGQSADSASRLLVATSIQPLGSLVREITGPEAEVVVILSPGASPHSFEPSPRVVSQASRARIVVRVGAGLDDWVEPVVRDALAADAREILVIGILANQPDFRPLALTHHDDEDHPEEDGHDNAHGQRAGEDPRHGTEFDPASAVAIDAHVWLDPLAMIPVCRDVGAALEVVDPSHADLYRARTAACAESLQVLHGQLEGILADVQGASFVAAHGAWGYFGRRYGLREIDVVQRSPNREPGPRRLAAIMETAERTGVRAVFTEVRVSDASARTVAEEIGVRVAILDPLGDPDDPERASYFNLMRWNARRMAEALEARP